MIGQGQFDQGIVEASYIIGGRPYCRVNVMGLGGRRGLLLPVMAQGGGRGRGFLMMPTPATSAQGQTDAGSPDAGAQVIIGYRRNGGAFVLGTIADLGDSLSDVASEDVDATQDADSRIDAEAVAIQNAGATVLWDARGDVALIPKAGRSARVQLQEDAVLRVSRDGNASDYAVLANPAVDRDALMLAAINELYAAVNRLALFANAQTIPPVPPILIAPTSGIPTLTVSDVAAAVLRLAPDRPLP